MTRRAQGERDRSAAVRRGTAADAGGLGRLLTDFNREFDAPTPEPEVAAERIAEQIERGDATFLVAGEGPDGFAQLRYRPSLYSDGLEAHLQELYVAPALRGRGIGRALLEAALREAKGAGADRIDLGTSEDDTAARALYESAGLTNREGKPDGPVMYVYEREL